LSEAARYHNTTPHIAPTWRTSAPYRGLPTGDAGLWPAAIFVLSGPRSQHHRVDLVASSV